MKAEVTCEDEQYGKGPKTVESLPAGRLARNCVDGRHTAFTRMKTTHTAALGSVARSEGGRIERGSGLQLVSSNPSRLQWPWPCDGLLTNPPPPSPDIGFSVAPLEPRGTRSTAGARRRRAESHICSGVVDLLILPIGDVGAV